MMKIQTFTLAIIVVALLAVSPQSDGAEQTAVRTGKDAFGDWTSDAPGVRRKITPADLPPPFATDSAFNGPNIAAPPADAMPKVPPGFKVERFATGLHNPREVRVAPNGDIFVAESDANQIRVLRAADGASRPDMET